MLDALRGFLALYVLLGHSRWLLWAGHSSWINVKHSWWQDVLAYSSAAFRYGHEAVWVFFALSGFFIHLRFASKLKLETNSNSLDVKRYFRRRTLRILPPYAMALFATLLLDVFGRHFFESLYLASTEDAFINRLFAFKTYDKESVFSAFLLLPSSTGKDFGTNGPLWSIAYEVVYYIAYPCWLIVRRINWIVAFGVIPLGILLLVPVAEMLLPAFSYLGFASQVLLKYPVWLAGAGLAELVMRFGSKTALRLAVGCTALSSAFYLVTRLPTASALVVSCLCASVIALACASSPRINAVGITTFFRYMGIRSYSIYIFHFPLLSLISAYLFAEFGGRPQSGWMAFWGSVAAVVYGCTCYEFCERWFLHRNCRISPPELRGKP
ncbi:acyltransferase family protein [Rubripirellula reticaptiva]|uniref:Acyltransferase family protein n=1 Tax=Rubripirellula reticaptiva TaxID=2528013 RepID=A0A5C6F3V0_9BACT|nr:Acyltransferase family protein [Rubripirellula reticaptiva]